MGLFSALFGGGDDDCRRLNAAKDTYSEHVDTVIEFTKHPDVRRALLDDPSLTQEQRKAMYKINNGYKGVEGQQTWKEWEENYERESERERKAKEEELRNKADNNQEQDSESRGWFGWF